MEDEMKYNQHQEGTQQNPGYSQQRLLVTYFDVAPSQKK